MDQIPTEKVIELRNQKLLDSQIIQMLEQEGFQPSQILEALNQAKLKTQLTGGIESVVSGEQPMQNNNINQMQQAQSAPQQNMNTPSFDNAGYGESNVDELNMPEGTTEILQEIAEKIVEEKWHQLYDEVMQIFTWKNKVEAKINEMDAKISSLNQSIETLHNSIFGKMNDYDENIQEFGTEIKAMNKVFKQFVPELKSTITDLNKAASKFKK